MDLEGIKRSYRFAQGVKGNIFDVCRRSILSFNSLSNPLRFSKNFYPSLNNALLNDWSAAFLSHSRIRKEIL